MVQTWDRAAVDALLRAATPSQVVEALGIAVVRRGANAKCICPFHDDQTPSLVLYDNWENRPPHYHCFACGADGDIFDLVRHVRHSSFGEAADWLRGSFGLQRPTKQSGSRFRTAGESRVWSGSPEAAYEHASEIYMRAGRGPHLDAWLAARRLPPDLVAKAELSFSDGTSLTRELGQTVQDPSQRRIEIAMLEDVGLVRRLRHTNTSDELFASVELRYRDFFSDARIIFPIRSLEGTIIGFAGRSVDDSKKTAPKYLYSPGLPKGSVLYRGDVALKSLREQTEAGKLKELFVCEGLVDALRLESRGFPAVSLLGAQASSEQINELRRIVDLVAPSGDLKIHIFLDRDKAGIRGSSKLAIALAENRLAADYIWPPQVELDRLGVPAAEQKDPDSLIVALGDTWSEGFIRSVSHPTALPVVAAKLASSYSPDDILHNRKWNSFSISVRYRAAMALSRDDVGSAFLLDTGIGGEHQYEHAWHADVVRLRDSSQEASPIQREGRSSEFIANEISRLNMARVLAKSGADRGEVPTDEAAWRRLDAGATAFNWGFRERLGEIVFEPMEPFDAVHVARDFEKTEPRLKTMPCPEDLVLQQYMLSETLTERFDTKDADTFSRCIPAVRYYRSLKKTITTAEDSTFQAKSETLSFAYQIDMDVLEGRSKATNQGMFRPYIECWRDFISSLRQKASGFEEVFALRLDLKRYYDRLHKATVRDALKVPLDEALHRLEQSSDGLDGFAPSFMRDRQNLSDSVTDWFCEHSFGYKYYHPDTGRIIKTDAGMGIPQGPVLSAWLATVALFPLDSTLRKLLEEINSGGEQPCVGYARYVDDIFLIADAPQLLERLRAAVEDACAQLRLEAIPKGDMAPRMTPEEFRELLTEGKALIGSGPTREIGLLHLGDGEAGNETWRDPIQRASALVLLSDRKLYDTSADHIKEQVFTALNAHDLRPGELPKASRWIWYVVAKEGHLTIEAVWDSYWEKWNELTERLASKMRVDGRPWHDPSIYALDGLERLLSSANAYDRNLFGEAEAERKRCLGVLSRLVLNSNFFDGFVSPRNSAPKGAGEGVRKLRRMFVQRSVGVRWIARRLVGDSTERGFDQELRVLLELSSEELQASLVRAWVTDADGANSPLPDRANDGKSPEVRSPLRPLFLWLHEAIVLLGRKNSGSDDPLAGIRGALRIPSWPIGVTARSYFYDLLDLWRPHFSREDPISEDLRLDALSALLAVSHVEGLLDCLGRRRHLLTDIGNPLPALPGIPAQHLVLTTRIPDNGGDSLAALTQLYTKDARPPSVSHQAGTPENVHPVELTWLPAALPVDTINLAGRTADWNSNAKKIRASQPSSRQHVGYQELNWAADCFESLARINYQLECEAVDSGSTDVMEYVPAWPYISASRWVEDGEEASSVFSLIGPVVPKKSLANFAFARDGKGRLRPHEVPLADARLWRIGYAVTDALGMADELERFRSLEAGGNVVDVNTAQYVLSRLLGRLRGEGQHSTPGLPHPHHPHLIGTTWRALGLLRNFPRNGDEREEVQYLLAVEAETAAMRLQLNGHSDSSRPGVLASMLAELAPAVFLRLTQKQLGALPQMTLMDGQGSAERRSVAAWRLLDRRLAALEASLPQGIPVASKCAWISLRRAVRMVALKTWIRALVFEIHISGDATPSPNIETPPEWAIDAPILAIESCEINIGALFRDALAPKGRLALSAQITPLGWLTILVSQLNLYGTDSSRMLIADGESLRLNMSFVAEQLAAACGEEELSDIDWPFDACARIESVLDDQSFEDSLSVMAEVEKALGYRVRTAQSHIWGLQPHSKTFTDQRGRPWPMSRGLIDQTGRDRHVEVLDDVDGLRIWTETTNRDGKLIGVSVLGESFARMAGTQASYRLPLEDEFTSSPPEQYPEIVKNTNADDARRNDKEIASSEIQSGRESTDDEGEPADVDSKDEKGDAEGFFKAFREFQDLQWKTRRVAKSSGHLRFAIFQFRIDDSYDHPLVDAGFPPCIDQMFCTKEEIENTVGAALSGLRGGHAEANPQAGKTTVVQQAKASLGKIGNESTWNTSRLLPSWNEHRRRRLIEEAIRSCVQFAVEVLILPEYSVRPDTVAWIKKHLADTGVNLSVVAGTYRLHGTSRDLHFKERFTGIFGADDAEKVFSSNGPSMEKSAYITLLQPVRDVGVTVFSRRKKYHSMAMNELINPASDGWEPLLNIDRLVKSVQEELDRQKLPPLEIKKAISLVREIRPAERMAELICSELFASTHPVNHVTIEQEYRALRQRFGHTKITGDKDPVTSDVALLTKALLHDGKADRRTIIVVPACTTRSADYWIYGQSALLAAGLTTLFCAAVLRDKKRLEGGGSCVIARSSWLNSSEKPGRISMATPYSGWSRGIYYSRSTDALSSTEQSVVIADIDPVYMNEGKPRPQALPVPIQLVAHLPLVEMLNPERLAKAYRPENGGLSDKECTAQEPAESLSAVSSQKIVKAFGAVAEYLLTVSATRLVDASIPLKNGENLAGSAKKLENFFSDPSAWSSRLDCWERNWRAMPFYGPPPALIDWLPVDLSPNEGLPTVFVPPWGGEGGTHGALNQKKQTD